MRVVRACLVALIYLTNPAGAEPTGVERVDRVAAAAGRAFEQMPEIRIAPATSRFCGASPAVNEFAVYCTSQNIILLSGAALERPDISYLVAHLLGHAVQVQHGVADAVLRAIRRDPEREVEFRSFVAAQVDCLAGIFHARTGEPLDRDAVSNWFQLEPFTGIHWGRDPLKLGSSVSVGAQVRERNFITGWSQNESAVCDVILNEIAPGLLTKAAKSRAGD